MTAEDEFFAATRRARDEYAVAMRQVSAWYADIEAAQRVVERQAEAADAAYAAAHAARAAALEAAHEAHRRTRA